MVKHAAYHQGITWPPSHSTHSGFTSEVYPVGTYRSCLAHMYCRGISCWRVRVIHLAPGLDLPCIRVMRRDERIAEEAFRNANRSMFQPRAKPPRPQYMTQYITALPYSSRLPPATTHSPAQPAVSAPLDSPPDSAALVRVYDSETMHLFESDGEDYSSGEDVPPQNISPCTKDLRGCLCSLFSIARYLPPPPWLSSLPVGEV